MGVSGALVWCVTNDTWIPFRLDAVKLSGTVTKAHWESVAELVRLLATNQLVLKAGSSSLDALDTLQSSAISASTDETDTSRTVLRIDEEKSACDRTSTAVTFNLATNSLHNVLNNFENIKYIAEEDSSSASSSSTEDLESVRHLCLARPDAVAAADRLPIVESSPDNRHHQIRNYRHRRVSSISVPGTVALDETVKKEIDDLAQNAADTTTTPVIDKKQYVPQETPNWLKLLQRYHDSKRLEKQIQRQREAWARNKRNLRRESVPKCASGLSRYVRFKTPNFFVYRTKNFVRFVLVSAMPVDVKMVNIFRKVF